MIIGIDARFATKSRRGIGNYSLQLISQLSKIDKQNFYILYTDMLDEASMLPCNGNFLVKVIKPSNFALWEQVLLPYHAKKDNVEVLHCLGNTGPIKLSPGIKLIVTLHDVMFYKPDLKVSGLYNWLGKIYRSFVVKRIINRVSQIITVSEFSRQDIIQELNVSEDKISVIWESYNEDYGLTQSERPIQSGKYILCLGAKDPRKNTIMIINVFSDLEKQGNIDYLIIVGYKNWKDSEAYQLAVSLNIIDKIIFKEYVDDAELGNYYKFATLFLYPSLYEGFGIPPLDAMACGCPVIASNVTSIPEIVGDAAMLVSPYSYEEIYDNCTQALNNKPLRDALVERGFDRIKVFSWKNTSIQTLNLYEKLKSINL